MLDKVMAQVEKQIALTEKVIRQAVIRLVGYGLVAAVSLLGILLRVDFVLPATGLAIFGVLGVYFEIRAIDKRVRAIEFWKARLDQIESMMNREFDNGPYEGD